MLRHGTIGKEAASPGAVGRGRYGGVGSGGLWWAKVEYGLFC